MQLNLFDLLIKIETMELFEGIHEVLEIPGLSFHFYCKKETTPFRKMGHITVLDENLDDALKKAQKAKEILKVKGSIKIWVSH